MRGTISCKWTAIAVLALSLGWAPGSASASGEKDFAAGIAAARRQDYTLALKHFESAARAGMREPLLYYNLGVSYYHQRLFDEAERAFLKAARSPKLTAASYYNLGLIARDRERREQAMDWFRRAWESAQSDDMRRLSEHALDHMAVTGETPSDNTARRFLWIEAGAHYDSNAALAADFLKETGGGEDLAWSVSGYGQYEYTRLRLHGLVSADSYSEENDFDFDFLEMGASLASTARSWRLRPGLSVRHMRLGGSELQDSAALWLESATRGGDFELKFYLEHESISAGAGYGYLDGTHNHFRATAIAPTGRWRIIWEIEADSRKDFTDTASSEFFSFSPRRQEWRLEYRNPLTAVLDLKLAAGLQHASYGDPDIRVDDAGGITAMMRREDDRRRLVLELGYRHEGNWRSRLELALTERDSNFDEFDYDRNVVGLNISRSFGE
jgi:hypothetical protein